MDKKCTVGGGARARISHRHGPSSLLPGLGVLRIGPRIWSFPSVLHGAARLIIRSMSLQQLAHAAPRQGSAFVYRLVRLCHKLSRFGHGTFLLSIPASVLKKLPSCLVAWPCSRHQDPAPSPELRNSTVDLYSRAAGTIIQPPLVRASFHLRRGQGEGHHASCANGFVGTSAEAREMAVAAQPPVPSHVQ